VRKGEAGFTLVEALIVMVVLILMMGVIFGSIANMYRATTLSDNVMLVNAENANAIAAVREDLLQTSRNFVGLYSPRIDGATGELRMRKINGFSASTGMSTYENYWTCYYLDTGQNILWKRYRDLSENLLASPPPLAVGNYVTEFTPSIDVDAEMVTVTIGTTKGNPDRQEDTAMSRTIVVKPFNID
jgi:type II secretory pathway pseudopilin PulG